jgi:hypothetical protein
VTRVRDQYRAERGQAALTLLAVAGLILPGPLVLFTFGQALGAKGRHQRAADLAAVSAAQMMRDLYPRPFAPPLSRGRDPEPRHVSEAEYLARARAAAVPGARRNGCGPPPAT